jgi:hypothetical protein
MPQRVLDGLHEFLRREKTANVVAVLREDCRRAFHAEIAAISY